MRCVWKYTLAVEDLQTLSMPQGAQILTVQAQDRVPRLWALVEPGAPYVDRVFTTYGTGAPIPDMAPTDMYVGTYQLTPYLVFHVFEKTVP